MDVRDIIRKYNLQSYGGYNIYGKQEENKWFSNDSTLIFTLYENEKTNHFLYLVQNNNYDTIFKYFDSTNFDLTIRDFFKTKENYFVTFWKPALKSYLGYPSDYNFKNYRYTDLYTYDSLNIYCIDSISHQIKNIAKPNIEDIAESFKNSFELQGKFEAIKSGSEIRLIKDTLNNHKVCYITNVELEIEKTNKEYILSPNFFYISKIEVDQKKFLLYDDNFMISNALNGDVRYYYLYDNDFNFKGFSKIDLIFHKRNTKQVIEISMEYLFDDINFRGKHIDYYTPLIIESFKYLNGEYFLFVSQNGLQDWDFYFPNIYHIDTINWKLNRVTLLEKNKEQAFRKIKKTNDVEILSNLHYQSSLIGILESFEIVKVNDEYRLIKKGI